GGWGRGRGGGKGLGGGVGVGQEDERFRLPLALLVSLASGAASFTARLVHAVVVSAWRRCWGLRWRGGAICAAGRLLAYSCRLATTTSVLPSLLTARILPPPIRS